jgi:large subunit ribosomal protein L19
MSQQVLDKLQEKQLKKDLPEFNVGDTISVHTRIIEGDKERVQVFTGTVIGRSGKGLSETVNIHRVAFNVGMERVFYLHSPRIAQIEVVREGQARRAKLYYLRGTKGKKARVKGRVFSKKKSEKPVKTENTSSN